MGAGRVVVEDAAEADGEDELLKEGGELREGVKGKPGNGSAARSSDTLTAWLAVVGASGATAMAEDGRCEGGAGRSADAGRQRGGDGFPLISSNETLGWRSLKRCGDGVLLGSASTGLDCASGDDDDDGNCW